MINLSRWLVEFRKDFERATFTDIVTPRLNPKPPEDADPYHAPALLETVEPLPIVRLDTVMRSRGLKTVDMRQLSRTAHYPPRKLYPFPCVDGSVLLSRPGWFRDDDPKRNLPVRAKPRGTIPWRKLTACWLHMTAADMSAGRFLGCPVQLAVDNAANALLLHALNTKCWHGHAANGFSFGIEVSTKDGRITFAQAATLRALIRYGYEERQRHVAGRMAIAPHRHSHKSRVRDCGRPIWLAGGEWSIQNLGMVLGPVVGSGSLIDPDWRVAS